MNAREKFAHRARRPLVAVAVLAASFASAAGACLPSIAFNDSPIDSGTDSPPADATQDASDGGVDARPDVAIDAAQDAPPEGGPRDAGPDVAPPHHLLASSDFWNYASTAACVVRAGALYCWGDPHSNEFGQLGFADEDAGATFGITNPTAVTPTPDSPSQIVQLVMAEYSSCAEYGTTTYCWGSNTSGQVGNPGAGNGGPTAFAVQGLPASGLVSLAAGSWTMCGVTPIRDAGNVSNIYCWGDNGYGELGRPVDQPGAQTAAPVTGNLDGGPLGVISDAVLIAGGGSHFCALTATSRILCWGTTTNGESGPGEAGTDCPGGNDPMCTAQPIEVTLDAGGDPPIALALGDFHSCALTQSGNVYCWGSNDDYELGSDIYPQNCSFDGEDASCSPTPVQVAVSGIQRIAAGSRTTCAINAARNVFCWGNDQFDQLGLGPNGIDTPTPQEMLHSDTGIPYTFDEVVIGGFSACGRDGTDYYCWGSGVLGTQTDAGTPSSTSPQLVQF